MTNWTLRRDLQPEIKIRGYFEALLAIMRLIGCLSQSRKIVIDRECGF